VTFVRAKRKSGLPSISEKQYQTPADLARHCQFLVSPHWSAATARSARSIVWDFLDRDCFAAKPLDYAYWIFLDFLGFSRPNRDFSMGCAAFCQTKISRALLPLGRRRRDRRRHSYDTETQYGSSSKPNSFSAFLQSIAIDRNCRFSVELATGRDVETVAALGERGGRGQRPRLQVRFYASAIRDYQ
jgi:hypothetical protein